MTLFRLGSNHNEFVGPIRSGMLVLECMPPIIPIIFVQQTVMTNVSIMLPLTTAHASPSAIASHPLDVPRLAETIPSRRHHSPTAALPTSYPHPRRLTRTCDVSPAPATSRPHLRRLAPTCDHSPTPAASPVRPPGAVSRCAPDVRTPGVQRETGPSGPCGTALPASAVRLSPQRGAPV